MKQTFFQKLRNPVSRLLYRKPNNNLEENREKNLSCKKALDTLGKSSQIEKFKEKDFSRIIAYYGRERVTNILSNSASFYKQDEIMEENKTWAEQYGTFAQVRHWGRSEEYLDKFVPDTSKDFVLESSSDYLNWAIEKMQKYEKKQKLMQPNQYTSLDHHEEIKGKVLVVTPSALKSPLSKQSAQLFVALDEMDKDGMIKARNLSTGVEFELDQTMVLGIAKEEELSRKTKRNLEKLFPTMTKEEEMFENARPFLGSTMRDYRTLAVKDNVMLVVERMRTNEIHYSTWTLDENEPSHKHDFGTDYESAKQDFGVRTGLIKATPILSMEEYLAAKQMDSTATKQVETEKSTSTQAIPTLSPEEAALFLSLSKKMEQEPNQTKQVVDKVETQVETVENETENVKEWTESREDVTVAPIPEEAENEPQEIQEEKELFAVEHCEPPSESEQLEGKVLVLSPNNLKEAELSKKAQLWLALGGAGCSSFQKGENINAVQLDSGTKKTFSRDHFIGALQEKFLPQWAAESKLILTPKPLPNEEIFQKGTPLPFPTKGNNRIVSRMDDTVLIATKTEEQIEFYVCSINEKGKSVIPEAEMTLDYQKAKECFVNEISETRTESLLSPEERHAIGEACLYVYESTPNLSEDSEKVLESILDRFLTEEHQMSHESGYLEEDLEASGQR